MEISFIGGVYKENCAWPANYEVLGSCHKVILAAYSKVFHATFKHDADRKKIVIWDVKPEVLTAMVDYSYTGILAETTKEFLVYLHQCSDRYNITELLAMCQEQLVNIIESH